MSNAPKTVRVRIAVAVDIEGQWVAHAIWRHSDKENQENLFFDDLHDGECHYFVEATLPVPLPQTVEGEVTE